MSTDPIFQAAYASTRPIGADFICGACGLPGNHELHTQRVFGEYHDFDWIRKEIRALVKRGEITVEENEAIACNSYERELMVPALTDEALVKQMRYVLANCFTTRERPYSTYNQAAEGLYAPELLRRYQELIEPPERVSVDEVLRRSDEISETLEIADKISNEWDARGPKEGPRSVAMTVSLLWDLEQLAEVTRERRTRKGGSGVG